VTRQKMPRDSWHFYNRLLYAQPRQGSSVFILLVFGSGFYLFFCLAVLLSMASDDLDIPEIAVVGVQDDNLPSFHLDPLRTPSPEDFRLSPSSLASSPSDNHGFLSPPGPILRSRNSLDSPTSPTSHTFDGSSMHPPPSPTLSAHSSGSIRWVSSTILRDNHPEDHDGLSSLNLLAPPAPGHRRKASTGTVSSIGSSSTERDIDEMSSIGLSPVPSAHSDTTSMLPSPTYTHVDVGSDASSRPTSATGFFKKTVHRVRRSSPSPSGETDVGSDITRKDGGHGGDNADVKRKGPQLARPAVLDLKQEADLNVEPFAFKPLQLASLVDPKSLETLESMGGVDALLRGLGTHRSRGLTTKPATIQSQPGSPDPASQDPRNSHGGDTDPPRPNIMITSPAGVLQGLQSTTSLGSARPPHVIEFSEDAYKTSIEDRQRIFGQNILPQLPTKSLLLLMWLALKDKVLVSFKSSAFPIPRSDVRVSQVLLSIAAVVSLALGLFQDFGTTRPADQPPVDWVEGVAIIAAILIVVLVGSLNDWQKEKQFQALNAKKEDRLVKVVRDGDERQIDIHQVVVGDVVLLEPGEIIPCDGVFLFGHNVRCDESGATGESDSIRKISYEECITLRDRRLAEFDPDRSVGDIESTSGSRREVHLSGLDLLGHTDCFVISGSKVLEGVGSYVVVSVGTKSFNGRIMMGPSLGLSCLYVL
jgi:P-type Ca2+ transporter type 2C